MTDDLHLAGFRLCPRQVLYIGDRYTRRCRSRKNPESSVVPHQSPAEPKRWRYSFLDRKGNRWMLIINDATGKVISKKKNIRTVNWRSDDAARKILRLKINERLWIYTEY